MLPFGIVSAGTIGPAPFNAGGQLSAGWTNNGGGWYYSNTGGYYSNKEGTIQSYTSDGFGLAMSQQGQVEVLGTADSGGDTMTGIYIYNNYDKSFQKTNDSNFATLATANRVAQIFNGTVISLFLDDNGPYRTVNIGAFPPGQTSILPENLVPEYTIQVGKYRGNAAAIARAFRLYPYDQAKSMIQAEINAANGTGTGGGGTGGGTGGGGTGSGGTNPAGGNQPTTAVEQKIRSIATRMYNDYFDAYNRASGLTRNTSSTGSTGSTGGSLPTSDCYVFNVNLKLGDTGDGVIALTQVLVDESLLTEVTDTFDQQVFDAVVAYQERYTDEILAPSNLTKGTGIVGANTRAYLNALCEQIDTTDGGSTVSGEPVVNLTLSNGQTIGTYNTGDTISYKLSMQNVTSVDSFYNTIPNDTCVGGSIGGEQKPWIVNRVVSNSTLSETVKSCQAGSTYVISVIGTNNTTGKISASSISVYIR
ncbi:MAG: hypothetical protein QG589_245 [Patescibacteria group bacterium]|nr:hypothetical protein [Patescibacteria group bacterium]